MQATKENGQSSIVPLWLNGEPVPINDKPKTFEILSAKQNKAVGSAVSASPEDAVRACEAAEKAFKSWRKTTPTHRRRLLHNVAKIYEERIDEIAACQAAETSCPLEFAKWNTKVSIEYILEMANATTEIRGLVAQRPTNQDGTENEGLSVAITEPIGPVLVIPPWNGAVILPTRAITQALAAGCTVLAGFPRASSNSLQVSREDAAAVTETLIAHRAIRKIDFIGSQAVGRIVGALAGKHLKPILMEFGGKGPAIVLDDLSEAEMERAAGLCVMGAILHHGQLCFSTERIFVQASIADKFLPLLQQAMAKLPPVLPGTAVDRVSAQHAYEVLQDASSRGAKFLHGQPTPPNENSIPGALLADIPLSARIVDEETFGPSASVYTFETDEEAVERANDSAYGLSAAVHSSNWERAWTVAKELEVGQVWINGMTVGDAATQPIRGRKGSGWGSSNGIWGINEFLVSKTIGFPAGGVTRAFIH